MKYKCSRCDFSTEVLTDMKKHVVKKMMCMPIMNQEKPEIIEIDIKVKCEFCDKSLYNTSSLKRHLKTCKIKKINIEEELSKKDKKIKELESALGITNITNNNTTNIQTQNNIIIQITPYNDPNLEGADKYYLAALKKLFLSVPTIIEYIHFNTDFPENHNLCIKNYRSKLAKVFNGKEWKTMDEDKLINELIDTYERLLEDWAEDNPTRMKYIEKYREIKNRDGKSKVYKDLREEVKNLIYDKRDMIKLKNT